MNFTHFFNLALLFGYAQGFTILFVSIFTGRVKVKAYLYLNLLVLFLSLNNLQAWITSNQFSLHSYYLDHHFTPWYIMLAPLFYLFMVEYIDAKYKKWIVTFSIVFFLVVSMAKAGVLYVYRDFDIAIIKTHLFNQNKYTEFIGVVFTISVVAYLYRLIKQDENQKIISRYENLNWLDSFLKISFSIIFIWMTALFTRAFFDRNSQFVYNILRISITVLIYWITYKAMYTEKNITKKSASKKKWNFSERRDKESFKKIEQHLESSEIYLNPMLKIEDLAQEIDMGKNKITRLIKKNTATNFPAYINSFRVERAKVLLTDTTYSHYTIEMVGLESGFNSNSAFYSHFKNITGKTPKQWQDIYK